MEAEPGDAFARIRELLVRHRLAVMLAEAPNFIYLHAEESVVSPSRCLTLHPTP